MRKPKVYCNICQRFIGSNMPVSDMNPLAKSFMYVSDGNSDYCIECVLKLIDKFGTELRFDK